MREIVKPSKEAQEWFEEGKRVAGATGNTAALEALKRLEKDPEMLEFVHRARQIYRVPTGLEELGP